MKMNKSALALAFAIVGSSTAVQAEITGNIGFTSNYLWRGVTQTSDDAAVQGGIDYSNASGLYAGVWASNITGGEEIDVYGGFAGEAGDVSYDVGLIQYIYPSATGGDFLEAYGILGFGPAEAGVYYTLDKDGGGEENDIYYYIGAGTELEDGWSAGVTIGHYDYEAAASADYSHYQLDIGKTVGDYGDFTFTLSQVDESTLDDDLIATVSWSKSF